MGPGERSMSAGWPFAEIWKSTIGWRTRLYANKWLRKFWKLKGSWSLGEKLSISSGSSDKATTEVPIFVSRLVNHPRWFRIQPSNGCGRSVYPIVGRRMGTSMSWKLMPWSLTSKGWSGVTWGFQPVSFASWTLRSSFMQWAKGEVRLHALTASYGNSWHFSWLQTPMCYLCGPFPPGIGRTSRVDADAWRPTVCRSEAKNTEVLWESFDGLLPLFGRRGNTGTLKKKQSWISYSPNFWSIST